MSARWDARGAPTHPAEIVLLDYLEGDLPGSALDEVHRHVARCRECRRTLTELAAAVEAIDHLPTAALLHDPRDGAPRRAPQGVERLRALRSHVASIAVLVLAATAVWAAARGVSESPTEAAPRDAVPSLATVVAPLGGRVVVDAADPGHVVVLAPAQQHAAIADAIRGREGGLEVELAVPAQAR